MLAVQQSAVTVHNGSVSKFFPLIPNSPYWQTNNTAVRSTAGHLTAIAASLNLSKTCSFPRTLHTPASPGLLCKWHNNLSCYKTISSTAHTHVIRLIYCTLSHIRLTI